MRWPVAVPMAVACVLLAALQPAHADDRADRERIARERAEADARFQARRRECEQRFAVTACVDEAQKIRAVDEPRR